MSTSRASERQVAGNHYKDLPIQPGRYIRENGLGWYEGNAIKYITRYKQKGGIVDIKKAIHYLELILEENENVSTDDPTVPEPRQLELSIR
jgi:hypothetical protein